MSDSNNFYEVTRTPEQKKNLFSFGGTRRKQSGFIAIAILGIYIFAGGIIGWIALNQGQGGRQAQASVDQNAILVASVRLLEDKNYSIGDRVDLFLTIQNPNLVTAVSNLKLEMQSAGDSVVWENAHSGALLAPDLPQFSNSNNYDSGITPTGNVFSLTDMAPSERVEYLVRGRFVKESSDYLAILAKINFTNPDGEQTITTNRVFTSLGTKTTDVNTQSVYKLTSSTGNLLANQKFTLIVSRLSEVTSDSPDSGNVLITSIKTGEVILDKNCSFNKDNKCEIVIDQGITQGGLFSSIFKDSKGVQSNILNISIKGETSFTYSKLAELITPLGIDSVNGILPVYVKNAVDANSKITGDETCVASILDKDSKLITKLESKVNVTNRQCYFLLSDLNPQADNSNIYFTLEGTNINKSLNFNKKPDNLLTITSPNSISNLRLGSSVTINANLKPEVAQNNENSYKLASSDSKLSFVRAEASTSNPLSITQNTGSVSAQNFAKLTIWHVDSGDIKDYYDFNGKKIVAENGVVDYSIPENIFTKEGLYKIKLNFDNNQSTDWLNVSFGSNGVGFVTTYASALNPDSLIAGNGMDFVVTGLLDKKGDPISQTDQCNAGIWTGTGDINEPILAQGAVSGNQCVTSISSKTITKTGPVTMAYTGKSNSIELPQAIQFNVKAGNATEYGAVYLGYSPALVGYSNTVLVGPVADKYGNLADKANVKLVGKLGNNEILNQDVIIRNGYVKTLIPSSAITEAGEIKISLIDKTTNKEFISNNFKVLPPSENQKIVLPNFPSTLNGEDELKIGLTGLEIVTLTADDKCTLNVIKNSKEKFKVENPFEKNSGSCNFKQPLGNLRDDSHLFLDLKIGQFSYTDVTEITSGQAANFFRIMPVTVLDPKDGVIVELLTTPILDRNGSPVNGELELVVNGKDRRVPIDGGLAKISIRASDFADKDFKLNVVGQKYLDIIIDAKASNNSIAATNSIQIFLGDQSLSNTEWQVTPSKASNYAQADKTNILEYSGNSCEVLISSLTEPTLPVPSFYYKNTCLVEINKPVGEYELTFTKRGHVVYKQNLSSQSAFQNAEVTASTAGYKVKVSSPSLTDFKAQINDGGRIYNYYPDKTTGLIQVLQPGLDANKTYLLEIDYKDHTGTQRTWFSQVSGSKLVESEN